MTSIDPPGELSNPHLAVDRRMVGDIYTSLAVWETLLTLCDDLGSRFAGTPGERRAAERIADQFRGYGLSNVALEPFDYTGWTRGPAELRVVAPKERELDAISLPYCPASELTGELVDVGMGTPEDFAEATLEGKLVLASSRTPPRYGRWIHRKEKYDRAVLGGAKAFLYSPEEAALGPETGSLADDAPGAIPGVSISLEEACWLKRLERRGGTVRLRLRTRDVNRAATSWNVVGELPGRRRPDRLVMVGCHYDGHDIAQGAVDPASGLAAMLEAARVLARHTADALGATVRFAAWGVEELGLTGSKRYVQAHADELDRIRFYLNLDSAGAAFRKGVVLHEWPELLPFFRACLDEMGTHTGKPLVGQHISAHSDHFNLFLEGVPTGHLGDPLAGPTGRGYGHTRWDTVDKVELADLREASAVACRLLLRVADADVFPAVRRGPEAVAELLDAHPNLEGYRVGVRLHNQP